MEFALLFFVPALAGLVLLSVVLVVRNKRAPRQNQHQQGQWQPLDKNAASERLQLLYRSGGWGGQRREIYKDAQTGVQYLIVATGYGAAVTPLLDRDGRPLT